MAKEITRKERQRIVVPKEFSIDEIASKLKVLPKNQKWLIYGTSLTDALGKREAIFVSPQELSYFLLQAPRNEWKWMLNADKTCLSKYSDFVMVSEASYCGEFDEDEAKKRKKEKK